MTDALKIRERALRAAIARRQYAGVPAYVEELRRAADAEILADPSLRREIAAWVLGTIDWAEQMIAAQRHIWKEESERIPHMRRYLSDAPAPAPRVSVNL